MYDWLKVIHVIGAVTWVGGDIAMQLLGVRALATKDAARLSEFAGDIEWLGLRLFTPASVVVVLAGIGMVLDAGIGFTPTWILAGLVGFGFSLALGAGFLGPSSGRIKTLVAERGETDPEVIRRRERIFLFSRIELVVLIFVVAMMVLKPS